jgi:hypothetical protein
MTFHLGNVDGLLNVEDYLKFIKIRPAAYFSVTFSSNVSKEHTKEFFAILRSEMQKWKAGKPYFSTFITIT